MKLEPRGGVLLVDDEISVLEAYTMGLEMLGFEVLGCCDGQEAMDAVQVFKFDAIVCDVKLPYVSGIDIYHAAKKIQPETPFIFFTGHGKGSAVLKDIEDAGVLVLTKPVGFENLAQAIKRAS